MTENKGIFELSLEIEELEAKIAPDDSGQLPLD